MERLERRIESFLRTGSGDFESLSLELFRYQFEKNAAYQAYCQAQVISPASVSRWQDIPAVPMRAFKSTELTCFPPSAAAAIFHSSSTTEGRPSRHFLKHMHFYEASLRYSFERAVFSDHAQLPFYILTPAPGEVPHSSLTWMFDVVMRKWGAAGSGYFVQRDRLDEPRLLRLLKKATEAGQPVALLGTTIAFLAFFDYLKAQGDRLRLLDGSRLLDTGGMKSQKRQVSRSEFLQQVTELLEIPENQCISEYGMCELSSQFYGRGKDPILMAPPWLRTLVMDAETGEEALPGQTGLLRHFDLANVDSVAMIQTDDLGQRVDGGLRLLGRAPGADLKGCSLSADVLLPNA